MLPDPIVATDGNSTLNESSGLDPVLPLTVNQGESVIVEEIPTKTPTPPPTSSRIEEPEAIHTVGPLPQSTSNSLAGRPATFVTAVDTPAGRSQPPVVDVRRSNLKPPMLLDTAICILLVLLFAIICRRMV